MKANANGTTVRVKNGSEGPRHDPYAYIEITVYRLGHIFTFHGGLACWIKVDGVREDFYEETLVEHTFAEARFLELTGADIGKWLDWDAKLHPYVDDPMGCLADYE